jgi:hypothetical protein
MAGTDSVCTRWTAKTLGPDEGDAGFHDEIWNLEFIIPLATD